MGIDNKSEIFLNSYIICAQDGLSRYGRVFAFWGTFKNENACPFLCGFCNFMAVLKS